ncbi:MAG: recombination-associated protein RdgC [Lentisphaeria bacterium]|nr:recombination-associated protein RdgC [Lentisphaeria bacterium]NQZ69585.1 recombination-associated protein RdgC [Lentisphaeria bacterium]
MGFDTGNQSFIICKLVQPLPENLYERFMAFRGQSLSLVGDDPQIGWVSGRHLLDTTLTEDTCNKGGYIHMNLRSAARKVPGALLQAECKMEELARLQAEQKYTISRKEKAEIKKDIEKRLLKSMPPSISGIPFVIDPKHEYLYLGTASQSAIDSFMVFLEETLDVEPIPLYPNIIIADILKVDKHHIRSLNFSNSNHSADPDNCGQDFCTWLWYFQEKEGGEIDLGNYGKFYIAVEGPIQFAITDGPGALESVVRKGAVTTSYEGKAALKSGKKIKRCKYILARDEQTWYFTIDADTLSYRGVKLPDGEELEPISHFQERMLFIEIFRDAMIKLFETFVNEVSNEQSHELLEEKVQDWVENMNG